MYPTIILKKKREGSALFRHPWIFSGAIDVRPPELAIGDFVRVESDDGRFLGVGTYSSASSIAVRLFSFVDEVIDEAWIYKTIKLAAERRKLLGYGPNTQTTGYRLVFGESDNLPGVVIDCFADVFVLQLSTTGVDRLRDIIVKVLEDQFSPRAIVERSDISVRSEENLPEVSEVLRGEVNEPVEFLENGIRFLADVINGQKTGFFVDQKDLRARLKTITPIGAKVLNVCSYSGATGLATAFRAGSVHHVDASQAALDACVKHHEMNKEAKATYSTERIDMFAYLANHAEESYDVVLFDPPALIKSRKDTEEGKRAYHFLNRAAMRIVKNGGILVTSSCSHFLPEADMAHILRRASVQAGVTLDVLDVVYQSPDHPKSIYAEESSYLKSFICRVRR